MLSPSIVRFPPHPRSAWCAPDGVTVGTHELGQGYHGPMTPPVMGTEKTPRNSGDTIRNSPSSALGRTRDTLGAMSPGPSVSRSRPLDAKTNRAARLLWRRHELADGPDQLKQWGTRPFPTLTFVSPRRSRPARSAPHHCDDARRARCSVNAIGAWRGPMRSALEVTNCDRHFANPYGVRINMKPPGNRPAFLLTACSGWAVTG